MKTLMTFLTVTVLTTGLFTFSTQQAFGQTKYTGYAYVMSSDDYVEVKYTRKYTETEDTFTTTYTIYHPTKGYAWTIVKATHIRSTKKVTVEVEDAGGGIFSAINEESTTYETPSMEPFGFRGTVGALGGNRIPNQLMVKFVSNKYENVKVVHVLGSTKGDVQNAMWFVLDEKN